MVDSARDGRGVSSDKSDHRALVAVLCFAGIVVSLSQTLVIPLLGLLPSIVSTSPSNAAWVVTVTLLSGAVAVPVMGRLGDIYPKKYVMVGAVLAMIAGSVLCAFAGSLWPMIIGRGLQGLGIGLIPLGIATMREILPADRLPPAISFMSSSLGVGGALGIPAASALAQYGAWQWMFWGSGALGVIILVLIVLFLRPIPAAKPDGTLDLVGAFGLAVGLIALLLAISKGADWGWASVLTLGLFTLAVVTFVLWGAWVLRVPSPLVDLRVAARPPVLMTNIASVLVGMGLFAQQLILPQVLQLPVETGHGLGQSMVAMGLWVAPGGLAMMAVSPISAYLITTRGGKLTLTVGASVMASGYAAGLLLMGSTFGIMAVSVVVGAGVGLAYGAMPSLIIASVPNSEMGSANSFNTLMRSIGQSAAAAVLGVVLAQMATKSGGLLVPTLSGFRVGLLIGVGVSLVAAAVAASIPPAWVDED